MPNSLLQGFTPRLYQETIFATVGQYNTLVVLPTGLGKTAIALMLVAHRLQQYPQSKCLLLAPTKPLVDQHATTLRKHLPSLQEKIAVFTGTISPEKRAELWKTAQIIVSTPQGLENDVIASRIDLTTVSALIVDEAHRATGEYSYIWLTQQYNQRSRWPRVLALTASPGSELDKVQEMITSLGIEKIEVRTDTDPDVAPYVQEIATLWEYVSLPEEFSSCRKYLKDCFQSKVDELKKLGYVNQSQTLSDNKTDLLKLQGHLQGEIATGNRDFNVLKSISLAAEAMKVQHAIELLETQGLDPLVIYLDDIMAQASTSKVKAVQNLAADVNFRSAYIKTKSLLEKKVEHPKLQRLRELLLDRFSAALAKGYADYKIILFTQYRDTGAQLVELVNKLVLPNEESLLAKLFVGQAKKRGSGLSQKEQLAILNQFRNNEFHVLVSSSVGEEGLDIPQVDAVFFYEPIPSAIRHIQRRGRTGRHGDGEVVILVTKGTRDEGYRWSSHHKEKRMYRTLLDLKRKLIFADKKLAGDQSITTLHSFTQNTASLDRQQQFFNEEKKFKIIVDHREKGSYVIKELLNLGISIDLQQLSLGDYLLSNRCAVEFKTVQDFVNSLVDGRLLQQANELRKQFGRPLYIIEGMEDIYSVRNIHPNAIRGLFAALTVDFGIPVLQTKSSKETAALLAQIAKREQDSDFKGFSVHADRKPMSVKEQQEYIITSFPSIGPSLVRPILKEFKTLKNFVNASEEELKKVPLLGDKKAKQIKDVIDSEWKEFS
ncbi:DEAD/DEAH box helicase [Candidatus Woesearchaeota archaeon]|nr:DEAD/DEAH box helicase [Candidatus Woesearchaeota archaeon]